MSLIERIAQFLAEWTGTPVSEGDVIWMLVIAVGSIVVLLFTCAWKKSGQIDWEAAEEYRKKLEEEYKNDH